jgi:hypothetical protein
LVATKNDRAMKIRLFVICVLISIKGFSQSVEDLKLYPNPCESYINFQFKTIQTDTISLAIYDMTGKLRNKIVSKEVLEPGYYKIKYTANSLNAGSYLMQLTSSYKSINSLFVKTTNLDSSLLIDIVNFIVIDSVKVFDTIKVYDTTRIEVFDTIKVLIIDTLDCNNQTKIGFTKYTSTFSISKSIIVTDYLHFEDDIPDYIELYEMSGKCIKTFKINSSQVSMQDLNSNIYIGLYFKDRNIINSIKILKK